MTRRLVSFTLSLAGYFSLACQNGQPNAPAPKVAPDQVTATEKHYSGPRNIHQRFANEIPGYGGAFKRDGVLNIYLVDLRNIGIAQSAVMRELRLERPQPRVHFVKGDYSFIELDQMTPRIIELIRNCTAFGVDTERNRYLVRFRTQPEIDAFKMSVKQMGLPVDAFVVELGQPFTVLGKKSIQTDQISEGNSADEAIDQAIVRWEHKQRR